MDLVLSRPAQKDEKTQAEKSKEFCDESRIAKPTIITFLLVTPVSKISHSSLELPRMRKFASMTTPSANIIARSI